MTPDRARSIKHSRPVVPRRRILAILFAGVVCCGLAACRSAFIEATIRNDGDAPIRLIEVDYPSASFGAQALGPHAVYHYRFKVQGSGAVVLSFTGADGKARSATGPTLDEGQHGGLTIAIDPAGKVAWTESLAATK
jgi:hypothetical protein